jgi:CHAT domain-containing protein
MNRRSAGFYAGSKPATLSAIKASIPENAALIEFAVYRPFDPKAPDNPRAYGVPRYVVYVVRGQKEVQWKDLGDASLVDEAIARWRQALRDPQRKDVKQLARVLDEKIMQPIRAFVGDAAHLLLSPDGELNLVPFQALVDEQGRYALERYSISYLSTGRDLLRMQVARESRSAPLLVADPLFGEPEGAPVAKAGRADGTPATFTATRRSVTMGEDLSTVYFAPLAGTALEANTIKSLFPDAKVLTGQQATKTELKRVEAPRLLHIATHGFFLLNATGSATQEPFKTGVSGTRTINASTKVENPLLRSGLALAGANLNKGGGDDGILTALEASNLNLWGTKLVTLSACDTGIGEVKNGEGVYGLRRAFFLAGTESLVMSLWPVSDFVTRGLMTDFYTSLKSGLGRGEALRQAQLAMLKRKGRQHPFYWASFIQSGEWANLDGKR